MAVTSEAAQFTPVFMAVWQFGCAFDHDRDVHYQFYADYQSVSMLIWCAFFRTKVWDARQLNL